MGNRTRTGSFRLPLSTRILVWCSLLLIPTLYVLLLALTAVSFTGGAVLLIMIVQGLKGGSLGRFELWAVIPALAAFACGWYLLWGLVLSFRPPPIFTPAVWVNPMREPELMGFLDELCKRMGVPLPRAVLLHATPIIGVTRGRVSALNANPRGPVLVLSLPMMACLSVNELRAVVAHEFAHFAGRDTLYGRAVLPVYEGLDRSIMRLVMHSGRLYGPLGAAAQLPLFLPVMILRLYGRLFLGIDMRISRARELRADAMAAAYAGPRSFAQALRKTAGYGSAFFEVIPEILETIRKSREPGESCYRVFRKRIKEYSPIAEGCLAQIEAMPPHPGDSHPTIRERLSRLPQYPEPYADHRPAMALLHECAQYERLAGGFVAHDYALFQRSMRTR